MQTNWDDYLKENKNNTDLFQPDEERMWRGINQELNKPAFSYKKAFMRIAAVALVLLAIGSLVRHEVMMQDQLDSLAKINNELASKEYNYIQQVQNKWDEYNAIEAGESPVTQILLDELEFLDTIYVKGLNDIKNHGYNERAVVIMLDTYEKRLRIIERLINEKRKQEKYENKNEYIQI